MKKRRQAYKRKSYQTKREKTKEVLYKQVSKQVGQVNQRLRSLERHTRTGTWASKTLKTRLSSETLKIWTGKNRLKLKSNMSITQLRAVEKAINNFLNSKTSTLKGIKEVRKDTIDSLEETFDMEDSNLTRDDYEDIYELFGTSEFKDITNQIPSSDIIALITDVKDYDLTQNDFLERLNTLQDIQDIDLRNKAIKLYNKFMR